MYPRQPLFLDNEHWIGLSNIYQLTNDLARPMNLHITMEAFDGSKREAHYGSFRIEDEVSF